MAKSLIDAIPCPVSEAAGSAPNRPALVDAFRSLNYGQLDSHINETVASLRDRGIAPGDVIAVLGRNSISYSILFFAAFRFGFILMPLNTHLNKAVWEKQLMDARCRILIHDEHFTPDENYSGCEIIAIEKIVSVEDSSTFKNENNNLSLDREALVVFSSGSGGFSRGVVLSWRNLYYSALGTGSVLNYKPDECWLAVLPFFHVGGISILFRAAMAGCAAYIMERFDADVIMEMAGRGKIQYISVVPTMLRDLIIRDKHNNMKGFKAIICGGAPIDETLRKQIIARKLPVLSTYGMTETSSMLTLLSPEKTADKMTTAGQILPYRELIIADKAGKRLPSNEEGKILVRGEVLFSRYLGQKEAVTDSEGWFDTGDIGFVDNEKYLTVVGRGENFIISGGENINLDYIEQVIGSIEGITGVVVMSGKDEKWGERPVAFATVSDDQLSEDIVKKRLRDRLPPIMVPDRLIIVETIPLTGSGKYDRTAMREQYKDILDG